MREKRDENGRREFIAGAGALAGIMAGAGLAGLAGAEEPVQAVELNSMQPTPKQIQAFMQLGDRPIVMVNLLKFKPDGGREEYAKYGAAVVPCLANVGAEIIFSGGGIMTLIGGATWDSVALVRYPNKLALIQMAQSPEYQAIHHHREEGLEGQINIAVAEGPLPPKPEVKEG